MIKHRRSTSSIMVRKTTKEHKEHKRSVSFNSMAEVCYMDDLTSSSTTSDEDETVVQSDLWWTARDYKNNRRRCRSAARRLSSGSSSSSSDSGDENDDDGDSDCRGLERMMDGGERRAQMLLAVCAVQREQARHRLDGDVEDPDLVLAEIYGAHCIVSQLRAERLGRLDAQEAKALLVSDWGSEPPSVEIEPSDGDATRTKKAAKTRRKPQREIRKSSSDRVPFRDNLKFSLVNAMTRRHHAWI